MQIEANFAATSVQNGDILSSDEHWTYLRSQKIAPDGKRLYVACSDGNVAAVVDVSTERSHVEGFIPTGWYPTAVRVLPSGTLVVLNGKGLRSYPNPKIGPNPSRAVVGVHNEPGVRPGYVGYMQTGTASWIEPFTPEQLDTWTRRAMANSPYRVFGGL